VCAVSNCGAIEGSRDHAGCGDAAGIRIKHPGDVKSLIVCVLSYFCGDAGIHFIKRKWRENVDRLRMGEVKRTRCNKHPASPQSRLDVLFTLQTIQLDSSCRWRVSLLWWGFIRANLPHGPLPEPAFSIDGDNTPDLPWAGRHHRPSGDDNWANSPTRHLPALGAMAVTPSEILIWCPSPEGSATGARHFEATYAFTSVTARRLAPHPSRWLCRWTPRVRFPSPWPSKLRGC